MNYLHVTDLDWHSVLGPPTDTASGFRCGEPGTHTNPPERRILCLFQIGSHDIDQFLGGHGLRGIFGAIRVQDMEPDMALYQFGHQAIQRSSASRHQLKHIGAFVVFLQRSFHGLDLSADSTNPDQELFFVRRRVRHEPLHILYPSIVYNPTKIQLYTLDPATFLA